MWNEVNDQRSLDYLLDKIDWFHDSCVKEMLYTSGAFVQHNLAMYPINNKRNLKVVLQSQSRPVSMIELEFVKLNYLRLMPIPEEYTCEILDATIILKDNCVIWCDMGGLSEEDVEKYSGTVISAAKLRWRIVDGHMGDCAFYSSKTGDRSVC